MKYNFNSFRILVFISILISFSFVPGKSFYEEQIKYSRVKSANDSKGKEILNKLKEHGLTKDNFEMLIVAYKQEAKLELYLKNKKASEFVKAAEYSICSSSGELGPKRKQGDDQVPEGIYHIDRFNPSSNFYLSLGLNYPNQADKQRDKAKNPGGDIFIHGSCVTIGCLPMTDDKIKEIYLYAIHARKNGQSKIPVYIFPFKMTKQNLETFVKKNWEDKTLLPFWSNLKIGYEKFESQKKNLSFKVDAKGRYVFL